MEKSIRARWSTGSPYQRKIRTSRPRSNAVLQDGGRKTTVAQQVLSLWRWTSLSLTKKNVRSTGEKITPPHVWCVQVVAEDFARYK